ncbi:Signal transducer regulating beta-lactamase production, contains metallopeptidase domain [Aquimarina amphilecti]|uniref:Signal transducer regulating beta-lactamase production, contains metallopeptidase domain n=1 Tax=Aquimarina amphilecti TaxID=1038014 RepID=A0A1H7QUB3_AQUAM|nr:M56 family metallopeptidase [Aquimarina amphilecti]SEL51479.1 Signal transducer regulating beta-lactamase production, contains metallopeptidase domain [Aquimarina amphilecti]
MAYIIYSAALIGLSYLIYTVFLAKETFYHLNRGILLGLIVVSFSLPFISVPENISFRTTIFQKQTTELKTSQLTEIDAYNNEVTISIPESTVSENFTDSIKPSIISLDWKSIILYIYILGVMAFGINFLIQLTVLLYRMMKFPTIEVDAYKIVETDTNHAPYSFWNKIFINPNQYNPDTYLQILKHEQMHISGKHSLDMLLVELLVTIQWFNPFAWLYRKAIDNNLEYLTDNGMLIKGEDKEVYQMNLLKVSTPDMPTGLATSYNQSFLKKRIIMMNSKKSTAKSGWKYLIIIPLLAVTVLSFNPVSINPSIDESISNELETPDDDHFKESKFKNDFTKGAWDAEEGGGKLCIMYRNAEPLKRSYWSITRCYEPSFFAGFPSGDKQNFEITRDAGTMVFNGQFENGLGDGRYTFTPNSGFSNALKQQGFTVDNEELVHCFLTDFDNSYLAYLKQEKLSLDQDDFEDIIHKGLSLEKLKMYRKELSKLGYTNYTMNEVSKLNLFDVDVSYIKFINKVNGEQATLKEITKAKIHNLSPDFIKSYNDNGYKRMSLGDYMRLKIHNVSPDFIAKFKKEGYTNISAKEAQNLKIHNVTPKYVQAYKNAGYQNITLKEAKNLKIHNVTPAFITSFKTAGYPNITLKEARNLKIHNVTPNFIESYKKTGQTNISLKEAIKLKIHNISPEQVKSAKQNGKSSSSTSSSGKGYQEVQQNPNDFIKQFKALGYENASVDDIISLKIHNVTPDFIKKYNDAGYKKIPLDKVTGLKIHNVTPEFINTFKKAGYKNISLEEAMSLKIHNVSPDVAKEYKNIGYSNLDIDDLMSLKIHNISPEYIKEFKKTKFGNLPLDDIMSFKIHNVTPEFIKTFEDLGYKNISAEQAQSLKIHGVTPEFVKSLKEQDNDLSLDQAIRIKIHF